MENNILRKHLFVSHIQRRNCKPQLEIHLEFRSLSQSQWSKCYPDADFVAYHESQSVSLLVIRIIKSTEDVTKRESEELQLDKLMPSREPMQDVKQAGRKEVPTYRASISKYLLAGDGTKAARAVLKETCT